MGTPDGALRLYLIRHGETAWSLSGQHTGRTDIPLTERGERNAHALAPRLRSVKFSRVFTSPRQRARRTCELAGLGAAAEIEPDLAEWDYGEYEGLLSADIRKTRPDWNIFCDGCPGGESPVEISGRADRLLARLKLLEGDIAVFSHGHFSRVLAARWLGLPITHARQLVLDTASISILGFEHHGVEAPAILLWNGVEEARSGPPQREPANAQAAGGVTVEMHLRELNQLFDSLDHSPFREKDLDRNAEEYIVESFKQLPPAASCALVIHLDQPAGFPNEERVVEDAVRVHFARQAQVLRRKLRRLIRVGLISLGIGLSFMVAFFMIGQFIRRLLGETQWTTLLHESLLIGGWVAMWKPLEVFLYDWWPILSEKRLCERLSHMTVRVVPTGQKPTPERR